MQKLKTFTKNIFDILTIAGAALAVVFILGGGFHAEAGTRQQEQVITATVQDKFSEVNTSGLILFTHTEYYLTVSLTNDTDLHDICVTKKQYHSVNKGTQVKCTVPKNNEKIRFIESDDTQTESLPVNE